jgi:hypothetical protein
VRYLRKFRLFESSSLEDLVQDLQSEIEDEFKGVLIGVFYDTGRKGSRYTTRATELKEHRSCWLSISKKEDVDNDYFHKFLISQIDHILDLNVELKSLRIRYSGNSGFTNTYREFKSLPSPSLNYDECNIVFEI